MEDGVGGSKDTSVANQGELGEKMPKLPKEAREGEACKVRDDSNGDCRGVGRANGDVLPSYEGTGFARHQ